MEHFKLAPELSRRAESFPKCGRKFRSKYPHELSALTLLTNLKDVTDLINIIN